MNCGTCGGRNTGMVSRREGRCLCWPDSVGTHGLRRGGVGIRAGCKGEDDCLSSSASAGAGTTGDRLWDDERLKDEHTAWHEGCTAENSWYVVSAPPQVDGVEMGFSEPDMDKSEDDDVAEAKLVNVENEAGDVCVGFRCAGNGDSPRPCVAVAARTQGRLGELLEEQEVEEDGEDVTENGPRQSEVSIGTKMDEGLDGLIEDIIGRNEMNREEGSEDEGNNNDGVQNVNKGQNRDEDEEIENVNDNCKEEEEEEEEDEEEDDDDEELEEEEEEEEEEDVDVDEIADTDDHDLDSRSADTRSVDTRSVDTRSVDTRSVDLRSLSIDTRSMDARSMEASAAQSETASVVSRAALSSLCDKADLEVRDTASVIDTPSIGRTIVADDDDDDDVVDESIERDSAATTSPARRPWKSHKRGDKIRAQLRAAFVRELLLSSLRL